MNETTTDRPVERTLVELHVDSDDAAWDLLREAVRRRRPEQEAEAAGDGEADDGGEEEEEDGRSLRRLLVGFVALNLLAAAAYVVYRLRFAGGDEGESDSEAATPGTEPTFEAEEPTFETDPDAGNADDDSGFAPLSAPQQSGTASFVGLFFLVGVTLLKRRLEGDVESGTGDGSGER